MSNVAITALPSATTAQLTDVFPFVLLSGPTTSKITLANIKTSLVLVKADVGLSAVENTALSTWAGSSALTTVGALTGGSTGAGFTVALSTSTITGLLAVAHGGTGTATPALVQGSNITITGTWPNQTIAASGGSFDPASPGPIGGTTPSTVTFTTLASSRISITGSVISWDGGANGTITIDANGSWVFADGSGGSSPSQITLRDVTLSRRGANNPAFAKGTADQTLSIGAASGTGGGVVMQHKIVTPPTPTSDDVQTCFDGTYYVIDKPLLLPSASPFPVPDPQTTPPTGWIAVKAGGATGYIPFY